jgi:hypothetical protein
MAPDTPSEGLAVTQQQEHLQNDAPAVQSSYLSATPLDKWWLLEVSALLFSAGLLVAIATILGHYDKQPQPDWPSISLNTVVSWLGTISRLLVLVPVTRSLGQLKWTSFAVKRRNLADIQLLDAASRGFAGSARLLCSKLGWCV